MTHCKMYSVPEYKLDCCLFVTYIFSIIMVKITYKLLHLLFTCLRICRDDLHIYMSVETNFDFDRSKNRAI